MEAVPMEVDDGGKKDDEDEKKRESTSEYLSKLGIGGKKRKKKDDLHAPAEKKKDYTADLAAASAKADELKTAGDLDGAIKALLPLEKKTRLSQDSAMCWKVVEKILEMIFEANKWKQLSDTVTMISKRRSALQKVVYKMVVQAMGYLDKSPDLETRVSLIEALRKVTEGKIFVELESARLARMLAKIKEDAGDIVKAADILQEVSVETCGSMEAREKAEFMLEQVRLCLAKKDWVRSRILSKKIKRKVLTEQGFHDLKLKHCELSSRLNYHDDDMFKLAHDFLSVFNTPEVQENDSRWRAALQRVALFVVLAPFNKDQADLLQRTFRHKKMDLLPAFKSLLERFTTNEIVHWEAIKQLDGVLSHALFTGAEWNSTESKEIAAERSEKYMKMFKRRTTEHNIRVISRYYSDIQLSRMSKLLTLSTTELEEILSNMVSDGVVSCKIDRPAGTVTFKDAKSADSLLDEWSSDVSKLLNLVEQTCHLIQREVMIHDAKKR